MTHPEIVKTNEIIAKFDESVKIRKSKVYKYERDFSLWAAEGLKYHLSWDWLMPVVEQIRDLGFKFILGDSNRVTVYNKDYDWRNGSTSDSMLFCVWYGVAEFIKFYEKH